MYTRLFVCLIGCSVLVGCATPPRQYPNKGPKNLTVNLRLEKDSGFLSATGGYVGIKTFKKDCSTDFKGWIDLSEQGNEIAIPLGQPTLVVTEIAHRSWTGIQGRMQRAVALTPQAGVHYEIDLSYVDSMFDVHLYKITRSGKKMLKMVGAPPRCRG